MRERIEPALVLMVLALSTLACNAFAGRPQLLPPPTFSGATAVPTTAAGDGLNLAPTVTVPADPVWAGTTVLILTNLNVRSGPGVSYERVGTLLEGQRAAVVSRDPATGWWQIVCPTEVVAAACWVSGGTRYTHPEAPSIPPTAAAPSP